MVFVNLEMSLSLYFGSGRIRRFGTSRRRGMAVGIPLTTLRALDAVLRALAVAVDLVRRRRADGAGRVERATNDVVADARKILHAAAADEHHAVLLEVVTLARDVRRHFHLVGEAHAADLAEGRVRLLRRRGVDANADATLLRAGLQRGRRGLEARRDATVIDELIDGRHRVRAADSTCRKAIVKRFARFFPGSERAKSNARRDLGRRRCNWGLPRSEPWLRLDDPLPALDASPEEVRDALAPLRADFSVAVYASGNAFALGAIVRVAHNFLARRIFVIGDEPAYEKASMGMEKFETILKVRDADAFMAEVAGRPVWAVERDAARTSITAVREFPPGVVFLFGSERFGIPAEVVEECDEVVGIPIYGVNHSLPLAVAAGIVMHECARRRFVDGATL